MAEKRWTEYINDGIIDGMAEEKQTRPDIDLLTQRLYEINAIIEKERSNAKTNAYIAEINADNAEIKKKRREAKMRLIDADTLLNKFEWKEDGSLYIRVIRTMIEAAPTMDAVPVVRCKDCKHWHREIHNNTEYFNFSSCDLNHHGDGRNFYCADAERKEE